MLRASLALLLLAGVAGIGYYFYTAAEDNSRARTVESTIPPPPDVNTGGGAPAATPSTPQADVGALTPPAERPGTVPPVDPGTGAPPPQVPDPQIPESETGVQPGTPERAAADPGPLAQRGIGLPIAKLTASDIHDTFNQSRGGGERRHEATDIMAPKGTPVVAVENGVIAKLFTSKPGGLTVYQYDPEEKFVYYYAHLDRYADGLKEGMLLRKGQLVGYVGVTGNSDPNAPHLHFAILRLGPDKKWYENTQPVDPYPLLMNALGGGKRASLR
jgi:murein DD-endopeptidase MepM/ murein hydrolase activator NlpD